MKYNDIAMQLVSRIEKKPKCGGEMGKNKRYFLLFCKILKSVEVK
jgi:hypothetical protein